MANFNAYIPLLLQVEGGYQAHPNDAGNYNSLGQLVGTNQGISARFYEDIIGRPPTVADIKSITKSEAEQIYRQYFWNALNANQINNQAVANTIVDHHVNAGTGARLAQQVLNNHFGKNLAIDNKIGTQTLAALNSVNPNAFVNVYNDARADYYRSLSNSDSFLQGWLHRLKSFAADNKGTIAIAQIVVLLGVLGFVAKNKGWI